MCIYEQTYFNLNFNKCKWEEQAGHNREQHVERRNRDLPVESFTRKFRIKPRGRKTVPAVHTQRGMREKMQQSFLYEDGQVQI